MSLLHDRYARHRMISGFSQELISGLRLAVVGAGAVGNEVIKNLLLMGVGAIDVYDFDTVELSNLTRSVFLRESDLGQNKAHALVARARELHPATRLTAFAGPISRTLGLSKFKQYDLLVAAVDNVETRLRINDMALLTHCAWINVGIDARSAVVELFPAPPVTPGSLPDSQTQMKAQAPRHAMACYACNLPDTVFEREAQRYSCGGLQRAAWLERTIPTTAVTASIAGALCVSESFRFLHDRAGAEASTASSLFGGYRGDQAQRVFMDTVTPSVSRVQLGRAPELQGCPGCGLHEPADEIIVERGDRTAMLARLCTRLSERPDQEIRFSDALVIACACQSCGASCVTESRLASYFGARANEVSDTAIQCPVCEAQALHFDIRESLELSAFVQHFSTHVSTHELAPYSTHYSTRYPDCAWLSQGNRCFDLLPPE